MRHGLLANFSKDEGLSARAENLAAVLAGEGAPRDRLALARFAAEAQVMILRIRAARVRFLEDVFAACSIPGSEGAGYLSALPELIKLSRYEGEALSQRRRGLRVMQQDTVLSSGGSSSLNIQELPNPETNPRRSK